MKKDIFQRFKDFKARHGLSDETIKKMVTEYANSDLDFARTYFTEKYKISEHTFYKSRDYAIILGIVGEETCKKLRAKAAANCSRNNSRNSARKSLTHFEELKRQRKYLRDAYSKDMIRSIANEYVQGATVRDIATSHGTGEFTIKYLLKKGIVLLILDSNTVKQISDIVGSGLNAILQQRENNKRFLLNCIQKELSSLQMQIQGYQLCLWATEDEPSIESLELKLKNVTKMYKEALQL